MLDFLSSDRRAAVVRKSADALVASAILSIFSQAPAVAAPATAAVARDALFERVLAGARAITPASIAYDRTSRETGQQAGAPPETHNRVERWDGRQLTVLSVDGRPPKPDDIERARAAKFVSGYHRLADFLKDGATRIADPQGRIAYRIVGLPKGSIDVGRDISASLVADLVIDTSGPQPFVSRLHLTLPKPLSFFMVAKLDSFDTVFEYRIGPDGRPMLVRQIRSLAGAQFGKAGTSRVESSYTPLH
jgi:hypothetical protein